LQKEQELLLAKQRSSDLGISENATVVHPVVQNVIQLNQDIAEVRKRRVQAEASLTALLQTVRSGGDLRQHLVSLEPLVGKELLLDALGINPQQAQYVQEAEKELVELRARQATLGQHLGPNHFRMTEIQMQIDAVESQLSQFQRQLHQGMDGQQNNRLAKMLTSLLQEELARSWQHEQDMRREFDAAEQHAVELANQKAAVDLLAREVDRLRERSTALLTRIENIDISQHYADVRASLISPPVLPRRPISPVLLRVLFMCVVLGGGVGAALVYLMDAIDDRFRSPEELQEQLNVPVMAMIRKHEAAEGHGVETLQVYRSPDDVASEAFRTLRTTLAFSGQESSRIVITSSEPSDGKTTVLANLGVSYTQAGKRTLLIDCDLRKPGLTTLFEKRGVEGVSDVLRGKHDVGAMCRERIQTTGLDRLDLLPSGRRPADSAELLSRERFMDMIAWAESEYDQILIDSPPVLAAADAAIAARQVDGVLVVVQPQKNHRRLVLRAFEGLAALGVNVLGTIVNAVGQDDSSSYYGYGGYGYGYGYGYGNGYGSETGEDRAADIDTDDESDSKHGTRGRSAGQPSPGNHRDASDAEFQASLDRISKFRRKAA
jgi:capsular exopolysaccharide synthesis family protein